MSPAIQLVRLVMEVTQLIALLANLQWQSMQMVLVLIAIQISTWMLITHVKIVISHVLHVTIAMILLTAQNARTQVSFYHQMFLLENAVLVQHNNMEMWQQIYVYLVMLLVMGVQEVLKATVKHVPIPYISRILSIIIIVKLVLLNISEIQPLECVNPAILHVKLALIVIVLVVSLAQ